MQYSVDIEARKLHYIVAIGFSVGILLGIYFMVTSEDLFGKLFLVFWSIAAFIVVRKLLGQPTIINLDLSTKEIKFSSRLKDLSFPISSLNKIVLENQELSFYFGNQEISMPHQITGLHVLLSELKEVNSGLVIKGC